jgi:hypothetical protein
MNRLSQNFKLLATFVLCFIGSYGLILMIMNQIISKQRSLDKIETQIIQEDIKERFNLFLDISLILGQVSSEYIGHSINDLSYGAIVGEIFQEKKYLLGLNQLDTSGRIVRTFPQKLNKQAQGKITQYYSELKNSFEKREAFWFSPPFELFQGEKGFAFYIPIMKSGKLHGWIAPVISSHAFNKQFKSANYFSNYELIIQDEKTGKDYFTSAIIPERAEFHESKTEMHGRPILLKNWRKEDKQVLSIPPYLYFIICFLIAAFITFALKLYFQKKKAFFRLESISTLLKLTAKEALSKLMDIQSEYLSTSSTGYLRTSVVSKDVHSVTNLIEQIDLLQTIAESEQLEEEVVEILPVLKEQIRDIEEIILKKEINLEVEEKSFGHHKIHGNRWLISNTILKNTLSHCVLYSQPSKKITMSLLSTRDENIINIHLEEVFDREMLETFKIERRLLVARNAMGLLNGSILTQEKHQGKLLLKVVFPKTH